MARKKSYYILSALLFYGYAGMLHAQPDAPDYMQMIKESDAVVGSIPGQFAVSPTGAATYTIPIECPPGINGMQPNISLVYNSQGGNGIAGWGWNIGGMSAITRTGSTLYHDGEISEIKLDSTDNYMLDGQRLFKISGSGFNVEYKLEIENYSKIVTKANSHMYFEVVTKDGLTLQYGLTNDSRIDAIDQDRRIAWLLKKVTDQNGNYILYNYDKDPEELTGEVRLKEIKYTGNQINNESPAYTIEFQYGERPDIQYSFIGGSRVPITRLLSQIIVKSENYIISRYVLYYDVNSINSKLTTVIRYNDSFEKINNTSVLWENNDESITTESFSPDALYKQYGQPFWYADFNGDGRTDMVTYIPDSTKLVFYVADGTNKLMKRWREVQIDFNKLNKETFETIIPGDFDADGLADFVLVTHIKNNATTGPDYVYKHSLFRNRNFEPYPGFKQVNGYVNEPTIGLPGDFDGDGKLELVFENTSRTYRPSDQTISNINYNQNINWGQKTHTTEFPNNKYMLDFNGDGKTDIMVLDENGYRIYTMVKVNLNNEYQLLNSGTYPNYNTGVYFADLNGDGKTDIITQKVAYDNTDNETAIYFSTGKSFYRKLLPDMKRHLTKLFLGDFNGDGRKDIAYFASATNLKIRLFSGLSFSEEKNFSITSGINHLNNIMIADFNGDGRDEIIYNNYTTAYGSSILSYSFGKSCQDLNVKKITDGLGHEINITYNYTYDTEVYNPQNRYQNRYPLAGYTNNIRLVSSYSTGNTAESYQTTMKYYSARIHLQGKGFLGFEKTESKDVVFNTITTTEYGYNSDYYNVFVRNIITKVNDNRQITSSEFINSRVELGGKRIFPYVSFHTSTEHLTGLTQTKTISNLDNYGNPKTIKTTQGNLTETQTINYVQKGSWCDNKPSDITVVKAYNGDTHTLKTEYQYDDKGNLTQEIIDPADDNQVTTTYSNFTPFGQAQNISITANGKTRTSSVQFTPSGRFTESKTNALGETVTYQWDETRGLLLSETDPWNKTTHYTYDNWGRLKETRYPDGNRKTAVIRWADSGNLGAKYYTYSEISGTSPVWTWYDALGREIASQSYGLNNKLVSVFTEYNSKGQKWRVSEPTFGMAASTYAATYTYDDYGRPVSVVTPMGTTSTAYSGLTTTVSTPEGAKSTLLNSAGLTESITANGKKVSYDYYASGLTKTATPEGGQPLTMVYNLQGKRTKLTDPDAGVVESKYNGFGELVWTKQKIHGANWITTTNHYFDNGLLDYIDRNGEITAYTYDTDLGYKSRLKSIEIQGKHKQSFEYDEFSRITSVAEQLDGKTWTSHTEYTTLGQVKKETYPTGYYTLNNYDSNGQLTEVTDPNGRQLWKAVDENARGQLVEVRRGGKTTTFGYDSRGLPTSIIADGVQNMTFSFSNKGNLQHRIDNLTGQKEQFAYDGMNRLTGWDIYSNNGLVKQDGLTYNDATSNIQTKTDVAAGNMLYGENGKPHALTSIELPFQGIGALPDLSVTYTDFKKIKTLAEGNKYYEVAYGVNDQRRKSVYKENGATKETRYYLSNYEEKIDNTSGITKKIHYLSGGAILIIRDNVETLYYAYSDYLGSLLALTDESGNVVEHYAYDPWGQRRNPTDWTQADTRTTWIVNRGYTGHEHLDAFSIINMNGRVYDPLTASFFSPDPYVQAPDNWLNFNRYAYAYGNPFKYTDPDGEWVVLAAVIIGAVAGGYTGYKVAEAKGYDIGNWQTWGYMLGGAVIGGVSGYMGATIAAGGGFMANTMGIMYSSMFNSMGMSALSGGMIQPSISFGAASYNFGTGDWGYLGKKGNKWYENVGYGLGALANASDIINLPFWSGKKETLNPDGTITKEPQKVGLTTNNEDWISHSAVDIDGSNAISWGPTETSYSNFEYLTNVNRGTNSYRSYYGDIDKTLPHLSVRANANIVNAYSKFLNNSRLPYNALFSSCSTHASIGLNLAGAFNLGFIHPYLLHYNLMINPALYMSSHYLLNLRR